MRDTPFPQVGISGLSGQVTDGGMFLDPVCTFTRCHPFAFGDLRVIMSEPSLNVQMIGCRARVGTQEMHDLQILGLQFFTMLEKVCFLEVKFLHVKKSIAIFTLELQFLHCLEN